MPIWSSNGSSTRSKSIRRRPLSPNTRRVRSYERARFVLQEGRRVSNPNRRRLYLFLQHGYTTTPEILPFLPF